MLLTRMFDQTSIKLFIEARDFIFISGKSLDQRGAVCEKLLEEFSSDKSVFISISHEMDISSSGSGKIVDTISYTIGDKKEKYRIASLDESDLKSFVQFVNSKSKTLVFDITSLNIRFLGAFLSIASQFLWRSFICAYTEPGEYSGENEAGKKRFRLHSRIAGVEEIPNLETYSDRMGECDWVAFLGFEGDRPKKVRDEPSSCFTTTPVICFPPMQIGWQNISLNANLPFIETIGETLIKYVSAVNPFATFNFLESYWRLKDTRRIIVSPFGTKPTSLGVILFLLLYRDSELLFDNPIQDTPITKGYGATHFYEINEVLRLVNEKGEASDAFINS